MKIVILGDMHFGVKDENFFKNQLEFYYKQLIPYCKDNGIKEIFQLGDIFEHRQKSDNFILFKVRELFESLKENEIDFHCLIGNHDIYFKNRIDVNTLELFKDLITIHYFDTIKRDGIKFQFYSWLLDNTKLPKEVEGDVILGHFETLNFEMTKGNFCKNGLDTSVFKNKLVFSGHFHIRSEKNNVIYTGTPYQITWNDFGNKKGFYVYNTETLKYEFIPNTISKEFIKIIFFNPEKIFVLKSDEEVFQTTEKEFEENFEDFKEFLTNSFLKIIVKNRGFEKFLNIIKYNNINYSFLNEITLQEFCKETKNDGIDFDNKKFLLENINDERLKNKLETLIEKAKKTLVNKDKDE